MLDMLEAGVGALRSKSGNPQDAGSVSPAELRASMAVGSLSPGEVANALSVPRESVEDWLGGQAAIPAGVSATLRVSASVAPSSGRKQQNGAANQTKAETRSYHPFSKIEEL
jgi:hypothetical protein